MIFSLKKAATLSSSDRADGGQQLQQDLWDLKGERKEVGATGVFQRLQGLVLPSNLGRDCWLT